MNAVVKVANQKWDEEYLNGRWDYLTEDTAEKSRSAIIAMYCDHFFKEGSILDVGCGKGTLYDFLADDQKTSYLGIDISEVAIINAKARNGMNAMVADASTFQPRQKFDVIVYNEVLYYLDHRAILRKCETMLADRGVVIVSMFRIKGFNARRGLSRIWKTCEELFSVYERTELKTIGRSGSLTWDIGVFKR